MQVMPRTMQLIAGRTGQEYNQRKKRKGAFWEALVPLLASVTLTV
jgi:hypothetical protein